MIDSKILNIMLYYMCIYIHIMIINYTDFKSVITNLYEMYNKKLFHKIFDIIIYDIIYEKNKLIENCNVIVYTLNKYISNYSFFKLCLYFIPDLTIANLKLYLKDDLNKYIIVIFLSILLIIL